MNPPTSNKTIAAKALHPPVWFRYGIIAAATLILCSCRAAAPLPAAGEAGLGELGKHDDKITAASFTNPAVDRQVVPALYQEDPHTPPSAIRQAEYAAGVRPAACSCQLSGGGPCLCSNDCPIVGPRDEYLCDGGDEGLPVGVRENWQIDGLEQEDTVAHYDTLDGRTVVTPSNQVCIYAPRFGVVRRMIDLHEYARYDMPGGIETPLALGKIDENEQAATSLNQLEPSINRIGDPPSLLGERQKLGELDRDQRLAEFDGSLAPYANLQIIRAGTVSNNERALVARASLAAITWSGDQAPQITIDSDSAQATVSIKQAGVVYHTKDPKKPRLRLVKLASCGAAQPGEEIEFTLRFDNIGSEVMGNVTIVDNLTTRLEYVLDSAKSSVDADFSTEPNNSGSFVLRWEITEPIEAGKGGILQFKARVR